jgi:hypothetical protein
MLEPVIGMLNLYRELTRIIFLTWDMLLEATDRYFMEGMTARSALLVS